MIRTRIAFFDVDGTLTTSSSMFRFLEYYLAWSGSPARAYEEWQESIRSMAERNASREERNRAYFTNLAGTDARTISRVARRWHRAELGTGALYHEPALTALRRHQRDGDHVVFVSGGLPVCLRAIAVDLGVGEVWAATPEIAHGRYTGALASPPMIGDEKAAAVASVIARRGTTPSACVAYGDHISDLPMLKATGSAVVVDGDRALSAAAHVNGWPLLPRTPVPPALPLPQNRERRELSPVHSHHETPESP